MLHPLADSGVTGRITFTQISGGVRGEGRVEGLEPNTTHGIHIHEYGDCGGVDGAAAGGHFAPLGHPHGAPGAGSHVGDLGNITADNEGVARVDVFTPDATLEPGQPTSIINRSVIVHAEADDMITQPSGNSGERIACGIIRPEGEESAEYPD